MADGLTILIVEDQAITATDLAEELTQRGHHVLDIAATMGEALASLSRKTPDVAIVDLHLADDSRADQLAAVLAKSGVRVLVVSGQAALSQTMANVPHVFIAKPVPSRLVADVVTSGSGLMTPFPSLAVH